MRSKNTFSSQLMNEMKALADGPWNPQQKAWFAKRLSDARPVQCVAMKDALRVEQLALFHECGYRTEKKGCFKNATLMVNYAHFYGMKPEFKYVEGLALDPALPISIEHAWVRVGDLYIDPTAERRLKADVTKWEYVALVEKDWQELMSIVTETGYYGDIYRYDFMKSLNG